MKIPVEFYMFSRESRIHTYMWDIECRFQRDIISEDQLSRPHHSVCLTRPNTYWIEWQEVNLSMTLAQILCTLSIQYCMLTFIQIKECIFSSHSGLCLKNIHVNKKIPFSYGIQDFCVNNTHSNERVCSIDYEFKIGFSYFNFSHSRVCLIYQIKCNMHSKTSV